METAWQSNPLTLANMLKLSLALVLFPPEHTFMTRCTTANQSTHHLKPSPNVASASIQPHHRDPASVFYIS